TLASHPLVSTPLRLGLAWPVLFYLLCGELLRKALMPIVLRYSASVLATIGLVLIATGLVTTWKFDIQAHYIQSGDFGTQGLTPLIAIIVTAGFILVFATWINNTLYRLPAARAAVSRLVRTGTPVVFIHGLVRVWMYQNGFGEDSVQDYALRLSAAMTISCAVALLVNSTPAARLLAGTRQEPHIFRHRHGAELWFSPTTVLIHSLAHPSRSASTSSLPVTADVLGRGTMIAWSGARCTAPGYSRCIRIARESGNSLTGPNLRFLPINMISYIP